MTNETKQKKSDLDTRELFKLVDRIHDNNFLTIITDPYRQRRAPKSTSANTPIPCVFKPIVKAFVLSWAGEVNQEEGIRIASLTKAAKLVMYIIEY